MNQENLNSGLVWWKVALDKDGAILSCEQADCVKKGTSLITYVQANSKVEACSFAKAWLANRRSKQNAAEKARNDRCRAQGLCIKCRRNPLITKNHCRECADYIAAAVQRSEARKRGENVPLKRAETSAEQQLIRARQKAKMKSFKPKRILELFDKLGPKDFRAYFQGLADSEATLLKEAIKRGSVIQ